MQDQPSTTPPIGAVVPDATRREAPFRRELRGGGISLEPLDIDAHAAALYEASHGDERRERCWTYMPAGPFADEQELATWYRETGQNADPFFYAVLDQRTGMPRGVVSFLAIEPNHGSIEIGHIWYTPAAQRTNVNTQTCFLLLTEAFDGLGYRRVEWKCHALNARSRSAALRLGFQFEGVFRQHRIVRGRNRDTAWFSIIDSEWPAVRSAMQTWLSWDEAQGPRPGLSAILSERRPR